MKELLWKMSDNSPSFDEDGRLEVCFYFYKKSGEKEIFLDTIDMFFGLEEIGPYLKEIWKLDDSSRYPKVQMEKEIAGKQFLDQLFSIGDVRVVEDSDGIRTYGLDDSFRELLTGYNTVVRNLAKAELGYYYRRGECFYPEIRSYLSD